MNSWLNVCLLSLPAGFQALLRLSHKFSKTVGTRTPSIMASLALRLRLGTALLPSKALIASIGLWFLLIAHGLRRGKCGGGWMLHLEATSATLYLGI